MKKLISVPDREITAGTDAPEQYSFARNPLAQ